MQTRVILWLTAASLIWGCTPDFPDPTRIDKLRVLAIGADRPEVVPGETVELSALVVTVDDADITYEWKACPLREQGRGSFGGGSGTAASGGGSYELDSPGTCHDLELVAPELVQDLGGKVTAKVTIPEDILSDASISGYYGFGAEGLPPLVLDAVRMISGVNYTIGLRVRSGDQVVDAFKRINVSLSPEPNSNPENLAFEMREADSGDSETETGTVADLGSCLTTSADLKGTSMVIRPLNIPENPPEYQVLGGTTDIDQPFGLYDTQESLFYSYFSTHGSFAERITKSEGRSEVRWDFTENPDEPVDLWIVVRDGRGGTAWCHSRLE